LDRDELFAHRPPATNDRIPFVVTYHPTLPNIWDIIRELHPLLHMSERCKVAVKEVPMMAFRRSKNIYKIIWFVLSTPGGSKFCGK